MVLCQRHGQSGVFVADGAARRRRRQPGGSRQGRRPRARPRAGARDHERPGRDGLRGRDARRAPDARDERGGRPRRDRARRRARRRRRAQPISCARSREVEPDRRGAAESLATELVELTRLRPLFDAVAALGERAEGVYLVGGTVRDILLGEESFDVDIAVEGDAIEFARALAAALGGRMTPHAKFGTAVVPYGDGERVDVVTTRTEFYDSPGALPDGRARGAARGPLPPRLHDQRDGGLAEAGRLRAARRPVRRPRRPRGARPARAPQPLVHRRPDADLPRDPLRGAVRAPARGALGAARARLHRDGPRRRPLVRAAAGRARGAARGSGRGGRDPAARRARRRPRDPPAPARGRRGAPRCSSARSRCATSSASTFPRGASASPRSGAT